MPIACSGVVLLSAPRKLPTIVCWICSWISPRDLPMSRSTAEYRSPSSSWSTQTQAVASAPTVMPFAAFTPSTRTSIGIVDSSSPCAL